MPIIYCMVHLNIEFLYSSEGQSLYTGTFTTKKNTVADTHSMTGLAHGNVQYTEASAPALSHKPLNQLTFKLSTPCITTLYVPHTGKFINQSSVTREGKPLQNQ